MSPRPHEKRRRRRVRTRRAAWIRCGANAKPIPCVLWDESETGARIAAAFVNRLPETFTLIRDKQTVHSCRIVWRKNALMGVRFIDSAEESDGPPRPRVSAPPPAKSPSSSLVDIRFPAAAAHQLTLHEKLEQKVPISLVALAFVFLLIVMTVGFYFADRESSANVVWAVAVCQQASNMCRHPEFTGGASVLMAMVYLAARGMEI